jgi:hypothetical protein
VPVVRQSEEAAEPCADLAKAKEACLAEVGTLQYHGYKVERLSWKEFEILTILYYVVMFYFTPVLICREVTAQNW